MARPIFTQEDSLIDICDDFAVFRVLDARWSAGRGGATGENPGDNECHISDVDITVCVGVRLVLTLRSLTTGEDASDQECHIGYICRTVGICITFVTIKSALARIRPVRTGVAYIADTVTV